MPTMPCVDSGLQRHAFLLFAALTFVASPVTGADLADMDKPADEQAVRHQLEVRDRDIQAYPQAPQAYVQRGMAYFKLHEFDRAIGDFSRAIALDDRQDDAYFGRGMARGRNGDIDQGIADLGVYIRAPSAQLARLHQARCAPPLEERSGRRRA